MIYLQVTRGSSGDRSFYYPAAGTPPTVVLYTQAKSLLDNFKPLRVITLDDLRWARRDIKTVQLLGPSMAKMAAKAAGVDDAWMVDAAGNVTESTSANAYIVAGGKDRHQEPDLGHPPRHHARGGGAFGQGGGARGRGARVHGRRGEGGG